MATESDIPYPSGLPAFFDLDLLPVDHEGTDPRFPSLCFSLSSFSSLLFLPFFVPACPHTCSRACRAARRGGGKALLVSCLQDPLLRFLSMESNDLEIDPLRIAKRLQLYSALDMERPIIAEIPEVAAVIRES
mgnify:CR=1 FL=1